MMPLAGVMMPLAGVMMPLAGVMMPPAGVMEVGWQHFLQKSYAHPM